MTCYQDFCIYQENGNCKLDEITINETGMCDCCICINIDSDQLNKAKSDLLYQYSQK